MKITLPPPPSANVYWRKWNNRMVLSNEARAYKKQVGLIAMLRKVAPFTGDVVLTMHWFRERKSGDLSNRIKVVEDALNGHAYYDDKQVVELHAYRSDDRKHPRVEIEITEAA